ncbi:endolytic transglycosylase MltG [Neisseriaceae bacterium ESL0693]|nr:endolytic transglycosylase MltG [Neisseriaceae bacterium ESL0693]
MSRTSRLIISCIAVVVVFVVIWLLLLFMPKLNFGYRIRVVAGDGINRVSYDLAEHDIIYSRLVLRGTAVMLGIHDKLHIGNYSLPRTISSWQILQRLREGKPDTLSIRIAEGTTFKQMRALINQLPDINHDTADWSELKLMQAIDPRAPSLHAEGLFFPATYEVAADSSDLALYRQTYHTMQKHLQAVWENRQPHLPVKTPYQLLTLASIIEKETAHSDDRRNVASVFVNRLQQGMRLQTDPTVIYGMGEYYQGNIRKADLRRDTPYNTYTRAGLPPTPISLPSKAALEAAANPANTDYLYFVARNDGTGRSQFSHSLREHNRAVRTYILKKH